MERMFRPPSAQPSPPLPNDVSQGLISLAQSWDLELLWGMSKARAKGKGQGHELSLKSSTFLPGLGLLRAVISMTAAEVSGSSVLLLLVVLSTGETEEMVEAPFLQGCVNLFFRSLAHPHCFLHTHPTPFS